MFMLNVYLLCKTSVVILSPSHVGNRVVFNGPLKQPSLGLTKKESNKRSRKGEGSFRPSEDQRFFSYEKASCPSERIPTSAPECKCKCCVPYLCWSCLLQWKAHTKLAGFISLLPGHVDPLSFTCGKSSKVLGLLYWISKSVRICKPRFGSEVFVCAVFPFWGLKQQPLKLLQQVLGLVVVGFYFSPIFGCIGELLEF